MIFLLRSLISVSESKHHCVKNKKYFSPSEGHVKKFLWQYKFLENMTSRVKPGIKSHG